MKTLIVTVLSLVVVASVTAGNFKDTIKLKDITAYGYIRKIGIPLAARIRKAEEETDQMPNRIVGGEYSYITYFPYQAGLIVTTPGGDSICGGALLNSRWVVTAGHCWFDGQTQCLSMKVVLGSSHLYGNDGTRLDTSYVYTHPSFSPPIINDIAMIMLPKDVEYSSTISPVALPSGNEVTNSFVGWQALASGFGFTKDGDTIAGDKFLKYVYMPVISAQECTSFEYIDFSTCICASGAGGKSTCLGDSGGPLVVYSNNIRVLVGIVSFVSGYGCQIGYPAVFTRVTAFLDWINQMLSMH